MWGLTVPPSRPAAPRLKSVTISRIDNGAISQSTILMMLIKILNAYTLRPSNFTLGICPTDSTHARNGEGTMLFVEACWWQKDKEASQMFRPVWAGVVRALMSYRGKLGSLQREWETLCIRTEPRTVQGREQCAQCAVTYIEEENGWAYVWIYGHWFEYFWNETQ